MTITPLTVPCAHTAGAHVASHTAAATMRVRTDRERRRVAGTLRSVDPRVEGMITSERLGGTMCSTAPGSGEPGTVHACRIARHRSLSHGAHGVQPRLWITRAILRVALLLGATVAALVPRPAAAQDSVRTTADSLAERLRRAEEAIALLRAQMEAQAESQVQAASRVRVEVFGRVMMNVFSNSGRVNAVDVPTFVRDTAGRPGLSAALRQTSFGLMVHADRVIGARFTGELHTDFFGGQQPSSGGRHFPLWRLRTARAELVWPRGELMVGQEVPLLNGLNPTSVAAFGTPEFTAAGNLWLWLPQVRGTWYLSRGGALAVQGALLAPASGDAVEAFDTDFDAAERSSRPSVQGRLRGQWMVGERRGEVGVAAHQGWLRNAADVPVTSAAFAVDASLPLGDHVTLRGEWYRGRALRGLGGGGIGQGLTTTGQPVRDQGGWGQLEIAPSSRLSLGGGCGISNPDDDQPLPGRRLRNRTCATFVTVRPGGPLLLSLGWRGMTTTYPTGDRSNRHLNLAAGFEF
jgi:hypothetical protein